MQEFAKAVPYIEVYKVIDNYKYGNDVNIQSRKLSVISFNEFLEIYESVKNDVILVITCLSFVDIIHQIENIGIFQDLECYIYLLSWNIRKKQRYRQCCRGSINT